MADNHGYGGLREVKNEKSDNARIKPERGLICELCSQFIVLKEHDLHFKSFAPFICESCYQELDF